MEILGDSVEVTTLVLRCDRPLGENEARHLRGFFGHRYRHRPEFHHHTPTGLIYRHPLIQYKTIEGTGYVIGLGTGSFLLRAVDLPDEVSLRGSLVRLLDAKRTTEQVQLGLAARAHRYRFLTPWLALNEKNFQIYRRVQHDEERQSLLNSVLVGNLLSLCKSAGVVVRGRLRAVVTPADIREVEIKQNVRLLAFQACFTVNFLLPELWGIGKQSARGFGSVQQIEE